MNISEEFKGVYVALLTPFDEKSRISERRLRSLIDFLILKGIDGFYICGSTGEGLQMDVEDRKKVAEIVKDQVKDRKKIICHIGGSLNTRMQLY